MAASLRLGRVFAAGSALVVAGCGGGGEGRCVPNEQRCDGDAVLICASDGINWNVSYRCSGGERCLGGRCVILGADGDADGDADFPTRGDADENADGDADLPVVALEGPERFDVPPFGTEVPSEFTDIFVSSEPKIYLVNDLEDCEVALIDDAPDFSAAAGTFCARTEGFILRGWAQHGGVDFIVDALSRALVSGSGATHPLPADLVEPTGLASDGTRLWVADGGSNLLFGIDLDGAPVERIASPRAGLQSVTWDGASLWVLAGDQVVELDPLGEARRAYSVEVALSGISLALGAIYATADDQHVIYRFPLP